MRERRGGRHAVRAGGGQRRAAQGREALLERRERREQQLDVVELQRHVLAIGHFTLQRDAAPLQLRVERQADELDVFGILGEVARGQRVLVRRDVASPAPATSPPPELRVRADGGVLRGLRPARGCRPRPPSARTPSCAAVAMAAGTRQTRAERLRRSADRVQRAERVADARLGAGLTGDQRQAAVIVQEEQAELRAVVEARRVVLEVEAVLAVVGRLLRGKAVHGLEVGDERPAERTEVHALVGERTEAEHHFAAARGREIVVAEIGAGRFRHRRVPVGDVDSLRRQVVVELDAEVDHLLRQEGFLQLRARHAQRRDVEMVDGVDAVLDERALAPAHDLAAETQFGGHAAEVELGVHERVEQARVAHDEVFGPVRQRRALGVVGGVVVQRPRRARTRRRRGS